MGRHPMSKNSNLVLRTLSSSFKFGKSPGNEVVKILKRL